MPEVNVLQGSIESLMYPGGDYDLRCTRKKLPVYAKIQCFKYLLNGFIFYTFTATP